MLKIPLSNSKLFWRNNFGRVNLLNNLNYHTFDDIYND